MKDTLGTLRARIAALGDTWTDEQGTVHERPTAWAYAQSCAALGRWRKRAEEREALNASLIADKNQWFAEAATQATRAAEATTERDLLAVRLATVQQNADELRYRLQAWKDTHAEARAAEPTDTPTPVVVEPSRSETCGGCKNMPAEACRDCRERAARDCCLEGGIDDLVISTRAYNCLRLAGIGKISQIQPYIDKYRTLSRIRNMGKKSEDEVLWELRLWVVVEGSKENKP